MEVVVAVAANFAEQYGVDNLHAKRRRLGADGSSPSWACATRPGLAPPLGEGEQHLGRHPRGAGDENSLVARSTTS